MKSGSELPFDFLYESVISHRRQPRLRVIPLSLSSSSETREKLARKLNERGTTRSPEPAELIFPLDRKRGPEILSLPPIGKPDTQAVSFFFGQRANTF